MIRTIFNLMIIVFVAASAYTMREDLRSIYERGAQYVREYITMAPRATEEGQTNDPITSESGNILGLKRIIDTPGALRVADSVLSPNNETTLTRKGTIEWTNKNRATVSGLPALQENYKLDLAAEKKLQDMFDKQYFEHESPSGVGVSDLGDSVGYEYIIIGENLALGDFRSDEDLVRAWMNSPGHRANILNTRYTEIGVAVGRGMFEGKETWLAVQHFGLPRSVCPAINTSLKGSIAIDQKRIEAMQADLVKRKEDINKGVIVNGYTREEQIEQYNKIVAEYNALIAEIKKKIDTYNSQVRAFNTCVEKGS